MEFLPSSTLAPPKNIYPCLATISLGSPQVARRGSFKGSKAEEEDENSLMRAISGGRRRTSFGVAADRTSGEERRKSLSADRPAGAAGGGATGPVEQGTWYWRVRAGVNDTHLVLLPLSDPANTLLTTPPAPLSHALPSHSKQHNATSPEAKAEEGSGLVGKVKSLFNRRGSKLDEHDHTAAGPTTASGGDADLAASETTEATAFERPADQTADGELRPSGEAMAAGATNLNGSAELGWPGVVQNQKLGTVQVSLHSVRKEDIKLGGGKKGEASWVTVPVDASGAFPGVGAHLSDHPRSGTIMFEFDKEWIGAKAEAELLHHYIVQALESTVHRPAQAASVQLGAGSH